MHFDVVVVGAGFAGAVVSERLASKYNQRVLVVESRDHIGGNAYDEYDEHGILVHKYGPHIFHTNSREVFQYLSQFTSWRHYQHRVLSHVDGQLVPFPINLDTINKLYGTQHTERTLQEFFHAQRVEFQRIENSEQVIVSQVGYDLYNKFFKGYTTKQWGRPPESLSASVCGRIPIRTNRDPRYFTDRYQAIPSHGYTRMFRNMLSHPNISVLLNTPFESIQSQIHYEHLFFSGPIDSYFGYKHGRLLYRSLDFDFSYVQEPYVQSVGTVNYPNDYDFTRITEIKHITGQEHAGTVLITEYPASDGDPYYPVPTNETKEIYSLYEQESEALRHVTFIGRLGTYRYYNMDQVVAQALAVVQRSF